MKGLLLSIALTIPLSATVAAETPAGVPVYNPKTKSYFELRHDNIKASSFEAANWPHARSEAAKRRFKGVPGRLAIVDSKDTEDFLRSHFQPKTIVWIGLAYWCGYGKSMWVNGRTVSRGDFTNWDARWYRNAVSKCPIGYAENYFMPVYYDTRKGPWRWQASGPGKQFRSMFVEYVTGGE